MVVYSPHSNSWACDIRHITINEHRKQDSRHRPSFQLGFKFLAFSSEVIKFKFYMDVLRRVT